MNIYDVTTKANELANHHVGCLAEQLGYAAKEAIADGRTTKKEALAEMRKELEQTMMRYLTSSSSCPMHDAMAKVCGKIIHEKLSSHRADIWLEVQITA